MVGFEFFSFRGADKVLVGKGLLEEVKSILQSVLELDHAEIQECFRSKGWASEWKIARETTWRWDAYKDKVAVSIEFSLIDAVHRDFLRAILAQKRNDLDVLVYVTSALEEPRFRNVKRDIGIFSEILTFPILLIGLT